MPMFNIRSGNLCVDVDAESYEVAVSKALENAPTGTKLGAFIKFRQVGKRPAEYLLTETFLQNHGMMVESGMVSLHSVYCDCERCTENKKREPKHG